MKRMPVPVVPGNFYAAGLNSRAPIEWANSRGGNSRVPPQADIGYRSAAALIGSGHDIVIPRFSRAGGIRGRAGRRDWQIDKKRF